MNSQRDKLVLGGAFVAALLLHAAVLPWAGEAVGRAEGLPSTDASVTLFEAPGHLVAGDRFAIHFVYGVDSDLQALLIPLRFKVYLSEDRGIDDQDALIFDEKTKLPPGGPEHDVEGRLLTEQPIPNDADGPYWLVATVVLDDGGTDSDRSNNTRAVPVFIDGPQTPELSITVFNTPDVAAPGGLVLIDYAVENIGAGWASTDSLAGIKWSDRVYLSDDRVLDETDIALRSFDRVAPLGPGEAYGHERVQLAVPRGVEGPMFLIAVADAGQELDQPSFTAGLSVRPISLIDAGEPDLAVPSIDEIERLVINRPSPVTFSVANLGSSPTAGSDWVDGVYLSRTPTLDDASIPVASAPAGQPLQPRSRYETTVDVTLPEVEPGEWYLVVKADAEGAVDEAGFEDNNTHAVPLMVLTEKQADAEITLGDPDNPERLVIQWIEHDRVEEHIARLSRTVQPALQARAEPDPNAPLVDNPLPPAIASAADRPTGDPNDPSRTTNPNPNNDAKPAPNAPDPAQTDVAPRPQELSSPTPTRLPGLPGSKGDVDPSREGIDRPTLPIPPTPIDPTPGDRDKPSPNPGERDVPSPAKPDAPDTDKTTDSQTPSDSESDTDSTNPDKTDATDPSEQLKTDTTEKTDNPETDPSEADGQGDSDQKTTDTSTTPKPDTDESPKPEGDKGNPATPSKEQTPTRAPKDESEAPPTNIKQVEVKLQEGKVLVGKGIKVTTKRPTLPGTGVLRLTLPRNARIRITFNNKGKVHDARVIKSTTYAEWDAAIEASLYRWTAEGEAIDNAEPYVAIEWDYLINELFLGDE